MTTRKEFDAAFTDAVNRLRGSWVAWIAHRVGDRDAAEDIVGGALTRAWLKRDAFAGRGTLDAWLWRCCVRQCLQWMRHERRVHTRGYAVSADALANIATSLQADVLAERAGYLAQDRADAVWDALIVLPKQQFLVTCYRLVLGYSTRDAATQLRVSEGTVKATLHAAKRHLRRLLAG